MARPRARLGWAPGERWGDGDRHRWEGLRDASATVILADGLVGSMQRSMLTGLMMIVPPIHPAKVFGATSPAVAFVAPFVRALGAESATTPALDAAVGRLCARFLARATRA